jgi:hypothetical protein
MNRGFPWHWRGGWKFNAYHSGKCEFPPFIDHVSQDDHNVIDCFHSDYLLNLFGRHCSGKSGARMRPEQNQ